MTVFAKNLKYLRNKNNYSQQYIANKIGITQRKYSYYENGQSEPNIETLIKLSKFFNESIDVLVKSVLGIILDKETNEFMLDIANKAESSVLGITGDVVLELPNMARATITGKEYTPKRKKLEKGVRKYKEENNLNSQ